MSMQQPHPTDVRKAMDYYNRGASFLNLGPCEEALAALNQAIALDPSDAESYFGRGRTLRVLKRYEEALIALNQAIALDPSHTEAYGGLGTCLEILGRHKEALAAFEQARRLNPNLAVQQYASKRRRDARNAARFPVARAGIHKINDLLWPPGQALLFAAHPPAGKASPLRLTQVGFLETVGCL